MPSVLGLLFYFLNVLKPLIAYGRLTIKRGLTMLKSKLFLGCVILAGHSTAFSRWEARGQPDRIFQPRAPHTKCLEFKQEVKASFDGRLNQMMNFNAESYDNSFVKSLSNDLMTWMWGKLTVPKYIEPKLKAELRDYLRKDVLDLLTQAADPDSGYERTQLDAELRKVFHAVKASVEEKEVK